MNRTLVAVSVLAVLATAGYWGWRTFSGANAAVTYRTAKVEKGTVTASVSATGTLQPVTSVQVGSQVSGQIKEILVDFNSQVTQGQLIAQIDPESTQYRLQQNQADLDAARASVATQVAAVNAQRANVSRADTIAAEAKRDAERRKLLLDKGFISQAELDRAQALVNTTVEDVKSARAQQALAEAQVKNVEAIVKQREAVMAQTKVDLARTAIKAPVDGIVIKRSVDVGQTVAASLQAPELFVIAKDLRDMEVQASIDEADVAAIKVGQRVTFTVDALPGRTLEGAVKQVRKAAQTAQNVVTYTTMISAPNESLQLLPGMTANVRILTASKTDVLKIANAALRYRPAGETAQTPAGAGSTANNTKEPTGGAASGQGGGGGGGGLARIKERLVKDLALSAAQQEKLEVILDSQKAKWAALRDAAPEERKKLGERNRADLRELIKAILTPEQNKQYELIQAEQQASRGQGGGAATGKGKIYLLEAGVPKLLEVRTGVSDGSSTEIAAEGLAEGAEIIIGIQQSSAAAPAKPAAVPGPRLGL